MMEKTSPTVHFGGWTPGRRLHAHLGYCICGSTEGNTAVFVRVVVNPAGGLGLVWERIRNALCPACQAKYLPLTAAVERELDRLNEEIWPALIERGCPCCEAGLVWQPAETVH